jgi:RNA polymerase II subunit A-like phosphatase
LQDILRTIHHAYYELYDDNREETKAVPDMKIVLPYVRRKVLEEVHVVFSGVVPTNTPLEKSKPYLVAKSLGAIIMDRVSENTTHIIAARLGTAKVNFTYSLTQL